MAALHTPLFKVHLGAQGGGAGLLTGGSSPQPPLATPLGEGNDRNNDERPMDTVSVTLHLMPTLYNIMYVLL